MGAYSAILIPGRILPKTHRMRQLQYIHSDCAATTFGIRILKSVLAVVSFVLVRVGRFWHWRRRPRGCGGFVGLNVCCSRLVFVSVVPRGFLSRLLLGPVFAAGAKNEARAGK